MTFLITMFLTLMMLYVDANTTTPVYFVQIDTAMKNITKAYGDTVRFNCEITGHPVPKYSWYKGERWRRRDDGENARKMGSGGNGDYYGMDDGGNYGNGDNVSGNVKRNNNKDSLINFNNNKNNNKLKSRKHRVQSTHWGSRLKLDNLRENDTGWYTCVASNPHGNQSSSAFLQVFTRPEKEQKQRHQKTASTKRRNNKTTKIKSDKSNVYEFYDEDEEEDDDEGDDNDVEYEIVYMENGDVDKYDSDTSNEYNSRKLYSSLSSSSSSSSCSIYAGEVCRESLLNYTKNNNKNNNLKNKKNKSEDKNNLLIKVLHDIATPAYVEKKILSIIDSMSSSPPNCQQVSLTFLCRTLLQLCHQDDPYQSNYGGKKNGIIKAPLCREDCSLLESNECAVERDIILLSAASVKVFNSLLLKDSLCSSNFFSNDFSNVECLQTAIPIKMEVKESIHQLAYIGAVCMAVLVLVCVVVVAVKKRRGSKDNKQEDLDACKRKMLNKSDPPHPLSPTTNAPYQPAILSVSPVNISFLYPLGNGHFGTVYAAQLSERASKHPTQAVIASTLNELNDVGLKTRFEREISVLSSFKPEHANVLRCVAVCATGPPRSVLYEFVDGVDLKQHLMTVVANLGGQTIDISTALDYSCQVAKGFEYLAERNYFHGDIAARNVVISNENCLKLTNLGISKYLYESDYCLCPCGQVLPLRWCPVERVMSAEVNPATEIWSLGVLIFEIFTASPRPYGTLSDAQLINEMEAGKQPVPQLPKYCPEDVRRVVDECFTPNPLHRAQAGYIRKNLESLGYLIFNKSFNSNHPVVNRNVFNNPFASRPSYDTTNPPIENNTYQNFSPSHFFHQAPTAFRSNQIQINKSYPPSSQLQQPHHLLLQEQQQQLLQQQQIQQPQHLFLQQQQQQQHLLLQQPQHGFHNMQQISPTTSSSNHTTSSNLIHSPPKDIEIEDKKLQHHNC